MNKKKICVIGLGYIGLPTAAMFAANGYKIIGVDRKGNIVNALNKGKITIAEPYLETLVQHAVSSGNLVGKQEPEEADVFIIAVPTPVTPDKRADISFVINAANSIVPYLREGNIVVLESTSPVGTVRNHVIPILEKSGLKAGEQLFVAYSPERVIPGKILFELVENNRIIGGINEKSAETVKELYKTFVKGEIYLTDETTAEMCKLMENTYRDVNIALANELSIICEKAGINVWEVIELCNKHPRVNIHQPGPGVGGHCIAIDPWFIVENFSEDTNIIRTAREINSEMPKHVFQKILEILKDIEGKKTVTIIGITYKKDVDDIRESPIIELIEMLELSTEFDIRIIDPYVINFKYMEQDILKASTDSDLILVGVDHGIFADYDYKSMCNVMKNKNILDTRNFLNREEMTSIGFKYYLLGN